MQEGQPRGIPSEVKQRKLNKLAGTLAKAGTSMGKFIDRLYIPHTNWYQNFRLGLGRIDQRLNELENAANKRIEAKLKRQGDAFDREQDKNTPHT